MIKYWDEQELQIIKDLYSIKSKQEIIELLPRRSWQGIQKKASVIHSLKVKYKTRCELNRDFFTIITNESAYLYGVLEAEGSINNNQINLHLGYKEFEWISNLQKICGSTATLSLKTNASFGNGQYWATSFSSKQWVQDLKRLGFLTGNLPPFSNEQLRYYLRGYFDGDGCIHFDKYNAHYITEFYGHPKLLIENIVAHLNIKCGKVRAIRTSKNSWQTRLGRLSSIELANYFPYEWYMLQRKSKLLQSCIKINNLKKQRRKESIIND